MISHVLITFKVVSCVIGDLSSKPHVLLTVAGSKEADHIHLRFATLEDLEAKKAVIDEHINFNNRIPENDMVGDGGRYN